MRLTNLRVLLNLAQSECMGHETWIVIGKEQHGIYWWIATGDCSALVHYPRETYKFDGEAQIVVLGKTLDKACKNFVDQWNTIHPNWNKWCIHHYRFWNANLFMRFLENLWDSIDWFFFKCKRDFWLWIKTKTEK